MRLLVVGGGVAGPAVALAATRLGHRRDGAGAPPVADPEEGSWVTVAPNGLDALDVLGVLDDARARSATRAGSTGCSGPPAGTSATSRSACRSTTAPSR